MLNGYIEPSVVGYSKFQEYAEYFFQVKIGSLYFYNSVPLLIYKVVGKFWVVFLIELNSNEV